MSTENSFTINTTQLPYSTGPYSYELIQARIMDRWRIRDNEDNAVGSANCEEAAIEACELLNRGN